MIGDLIFQPRKEHDHGDVDQQKMVLKVSAEAGKTAFDSVTAMKAATATEATETSPTVVVAAEVVETVAVVAAADVATTVQMMTTVVYVVQPG